MHLGKLRIACKNIQNIQFYIDLHVCLKNILTTVLAILSILPLAYGYNVLVLMAFPGPSHHVYIAEFVKVLTNHSHHVTAIVNFSLKGLKGANYTEILIDPIYDLKQNSNIQNTNSICV